MTNRDAFNKLMDKMTEMQAELAQHNWPEEERNGKAAAFRIELFQAITDYRDWWVDRTKGIYSPAEEMYYDAMAEAEDEAKAIEEEIEEENNAYYDSIINPNRL